MEDLINEIFNNLNNVNLNEIFEKIISSYLGNDSLTQDIKNLIQEVYSQCKIKRDSLIEENLNTTAEKEAQKMENDLKNIVTDVLVKFDNIITIEQKGFFEESKKKVYESLSYTAQEIGKNNLDSETKILNLPKKLKKKKKNQNKKKLLHRQ